MPVKTEWAWHLILQYRLVVNERGGGMATLNHLVDVLVNAIATLLALSILLNFLVIEFIVINSISSNPNYNINTKQRRAKTVNRDVFGTFVSNNAAAA